MTACANKNQIWNLAKTAAVFNVSVGLVSENLKLANAIHLNEDVMNEPNRQAALDRIKR